MDAPRTHPPGDGPFPRPQEQIPARPPALAELPRSAGVAAFSAKVPESEGLSGLRSFDLDGSCVQRPGHYSQRREGI
jgi:hypothetical protein